MSVALHLRARYITGDLPFKPVATRYWELAGQIKRQQIGDFVLESLYVSPDEWYVEIVCKGDQHGA